MGKIRPEREVHHDFIETSFTITRPSTTTQYAVNDTLADSTSTSYAIQVANVGKDDGDSVNITGVYVTSTAAETLLPELMIYLFSVPPTSPVDNAAFTINTYENNNIVATAQIDSWTSSAVNCRGQKDSINIPAKCASDDINLYALVKVLNTYTPEANEVFKFTLQIERN